MTIRRRQDRSILEYEFRDQATPDIVDAVVQRIRLLGWSSALDGGGAEYARAESAPSHDAWFRTKDGSIWALTYVGGVDPMQVGGAGDGETDDVDQIAAAAAVGGSVSISGSHAIAQTLSIDQPTVISGQSRNSNSFVLTTSTAKVEVGKNANAAVCQIRGLTLDGTDTASVCLSLYDNGNAKNGFRLIDANVRGWLDTGISLGEESDNFRLEGVRLGPARSAASTAAAIRATPSAPAAPWKSTGSILSAAQGKAIIGSEALTSVQDRINFFAHGFVEHNGRTDASIAQFIATFFENCGYDGENAPLKGQTAFLCTSGAIGIYTPEKLALNYAQTSFWATGSGRFDIAPGACPIVGNNIVGTREGVFLFRNGAAGVANDGMGIDLHAPARIDDWTRFWGRYLRFDAGSTQINAGDTIVGATSGDTGLVHSVTTTGSGSWAGGNQGGYLVLRNCTGEFQDNEILQVSAAAVAVANGVAASEGAVARMEPLTSGFPLRLYGFPVIEQHLDGTVSGSGFAATGTGSSLAQTTTAGEFLTNGGGWRLTCGNTNTDDRATKTWSGGIPETEGKMLIAQVAMKGVADTVPDFRLRLRFTGDGMEGDTSPNTWAGRWDYSDGDNVWSYHVCGCYIVDETEDLTLDIFGGQTITTDAKVFIDRVVISAL